MPLGPNASTSVAQVACVHYPGLPDAPRAALVAELFTGGGAGGMLAFELRGGAQTADAVLQVRAH